jgi:hypothetical protein
MVFIQKVKSDSLDFAYMRACVKHFSVPQSSHSALKLLLTTPVTFEQPSCDEINSSTDLRTLIWQFPDGDMLQLVSAIEMNPDDADCYITVIFLQALECELATAVTAHDLHQMIVCVTLTELLIRMKCMGSSVKEAFFQTILSLLITGLPDLPEDAIYDICDVLSLIVIMWYPSDWIDVDIVVLTCELHMTALQNGRFDDRERAYRFFHNLFIAVPDQAPSFISLDYFSCIFEFLMEGDLIYEDDYFLTVFPLLLRACEVGYPLNVFEDYLQELEPDERVSE